MHALFPSVTVTTFCINELVNYVSLVAPMRATVKLILDYILEKSKNGRQGCSNRQTHTGNEWYFMYRLNSDCQRVIVLSNRAIIME